MLKDQTEDFFRALPRTEKERWKWQSQTILVAKNMEYVQFLSEPKGEKSENEEDWYNQSTEGDSSFLKALIDVADAMDDGIVSAEKNCGLGSRISGSDAEATSEKAEKKKKQYRSHSSYLRNSKLCEEAIKLEF